MYRLRILIALGSICLLFNCVDTTSGGFFFIDTPAKIGSAEPSLYVTPNERLLLSWIEPISRDEHSLLFSEFKSGRWLDAKTIATGSEWFVNWADFPSLSAMNDGNLVAHFLEKSGPDTYAYDVKLTISNDDGKSWMPSFKPHNDDTETEHGFVSKLRLSDSTLMATWLDGRQYAYAKADSSIMEQMSLRSAIIDTNGNLLREFLIDERVCDCCQTDMAMTSEGPIVVYRNRSDSEIRDIYFSRYLNGSWSNPQTVYNDDWKIFGCPVNGPAIASRNKKVAISWFALNNDRPEVKVSFYNNSEQVFEEPYRPDQINPLGRVDISWISDERVVVCWMDKLDGDAHIKLQTLSQNGEFGDIHTVEVTSIERSSGFPRIAVHKDKLFITWTNSDETTQIRTAYINIDNL
ncbi:MAG: exo-alpha-sialidase [Flavobacteriaceae bacterium]|nr:exo-alpha-sialidase [Flavobacteriaceae bacterium]